MPDISDSSTEVALPVEADSVGMEFAPYEPTPTANPAWEAPDSPPAEAFDFAEVRRRPPADDIDPDVVLFEQVPPGGRGTKSQPAEQRAFRDQNGPAPASKRPSKTRPKEPGSGATPAAPAWFGRRKEAPPEIVVEEDQPLAWPERLKGYVFGRGGAAYVVSTAIHVLFLLILAWIVFDPTGPEGPLGIVGTFDEEALDGDADVLDTILADDGKDPTDETLPVLMENAFDQLDEAAMQPSDPSVAQPSPDSGAGSGAGDGQDAADGAGMGLPFARPGSGGKVVTQGSFTVWTVPEDPRPGEKYLIVVEVRIPEKFKHMKTFPVRDLSGFVVGTDGYQQRFPSRFAPQHLPISKGVTQFAIPVPGADRLVEDTIDVRSINIVRESQRLKIVF